MPTIFDFSNVRVKDKNCCTLRPVVISGEKNPSPPDTGEMRGCCVPMCNSNKKRDKISFHEMPSNEEQREKWMEAIMNHTPPNESQWYPDQYDLVCAKHFTADDFRPTSSVRCLKSGAVPSVFAGSPECEQRRGPSKYFKNSVLELDLEEIVHTQKSISLAQNLSGSSAFGPKNLKLIKKSQRHTEKRLLRTGKIKGNVKKQITSSADLSAEAFASQTPMVTYLPRVTSSRAAKDVSASPAGGSTHTQMHDSPKLEKGISLLSDEVIYHEQQILQRKIPETSDFVTAGNVNTMSSYKNFLMKELDFAQEEIFELQACIARLKEQNVKLQGEKNSVLVTNLHDIKQDAVDGNYDAIVLLNCIVHYSLQRT